MKLYLVRHGESLDNLQGKVSVDDSSLTEVGIKQVKELAKRVFSTIKIDAIYTSPYLRTEQTAEKISVYHAQTPLIKTELIVEKKDPSSFTGKQREQLPWDIIKKNRLNPDWSYEDGESFNDIKARIEKIFRHIEMKYPIESNIIFVTHHSFIKHLVACVILGKYFKPEFYYEFADRLETKNTGITILEYKQKYYEKKPSWYLISWMV